MESELYFKVLFFKGINDGPLYTTYDILKMVMIRYGIDINLNDYTTIRKYARACKGIEREIIKPSVDYAIKHNRKIEAIKIYRYLNNATLSESKEYVENRANELGVELKY